MIDGKKNILAYFDSLKCPYYALFNKGKVESGNVIRRNDKTEDTYDFKDGRDSFETTLNLLSHGEYTLILSDSKDVTKKGGNRIDFRISISEGNNSGMPAGASISGPSGLSIEDVKKMADERFAKLMGEQELKQLKEKIEELKKENRELEKATRDPWNNVIAKVSPYTEHIIAGFFGNKPPANLPISGIKPDAVSEANQDPEKIAGEFLEALAASKPDEWLQILQKLTHLIKNEVSKFNTALNFL